MKILVINAGSSSLKYQLMDSESGYVIAKGLCERIGIDGAMTYKPTGREPVQFNDTLKDHTDAIKLVINTLTNPEIGVVKSMDEIDAVGHRLVHGGEKFAKSVLITEEVIQTVESLNSLAPLHNPANLMGVRACMEIMPDVPMVAVFDTAFHQTMPREAFLYGLPYEAYTDHMVRRYGFHGTSHLYVSRKAIEMLGKPVEETKVVTCHLGNGSSITAVKGGKSVDTSMGLTPLEGVPMGTRCGSIDPAIVTYLMDKLGLDAKGIDNYMNKKSGVMGISGVSSDFRDITAAAKEGNDRAKAGNDRAKAALECFAYHVKKYIGAYSAAMGGVDAIVFTAGVGENHRLLREMILTGLDYLGVDVDFEYNMNCPGGQDVELTKPGSKVKVYVIPTDEEMVIAQDTARLSAK